MGQVKTVQFERSLGFIVPATAMLVFDILEEFDDGGEEDRMEFFIAYAPNVMRRHLTTGNYPE